MPLTSSVIPYENAISCSSSCLFVLFITQHNYIYLNKVTMAILNRCPLNYIYFQLLVVLTLYV